MTASTRTPRLPFNRLQEGLRPRTCTKLRRSSKRVAWPRGSSDDPHIPLSPGALNMETLRALVGNWACTVEAPVGETTAPARPRRASFVRYHVPFGSRTASPYKAPKETGHMQHICFQCLAGGGVTCGQPPSNKQRPLSGPRNKVTTHWSVSFVAQHLRRAPALLAAAYYQNERRTLRHRIGDPSRRLFGTRLLCSSPGARSQCRQSGGDCLATCGASGYRLAFPSAPMLC